MTPREMRSLLSNEQFRPFEIVMNNGERHGVHHPEFAIVTDANAIHLYQPSSRNEKLASFDFKVIVLRNIASIEPLQTQAT